MELRSAVEVLAEAFGDGWTANDVGPSLTCGEANALASVLACCGHYDDAAALLDGHATGDEADDLHADMSWYALREYARMLVGEANIVDVLERALTDAGGLHARELRERSQRMTATLDGVVVGMVDRAAVVGALAGCQSWMEAEDVITVARGGT